MATSTNKYLVLLVSLGLIGAHAGCASGKQPANVALVSHASKEAPASVAPASNQAALPEVGRRAVVELVAALTLRPSATRHHAVQLLSLPEEELLLFDFDLSTHDDDEPTLKLVSRHFDGKTWGQKEEIGDAQQPELLQAAANGSGAAVVVWVGPFGAHAALRRPGTPGWGKHVELNGGFTFAVASGITEQGDVFALSYHPTLMSLQGKTTPEVTRWARLASNSEEWVSGELPDVRRPTGGRDRRVTGLALDSGGAGAAVVLRKDLLPVDREGRYQPTSGTYVGIVEPLAYQFVPERGAFGEAIAFATIEKAHLLGLSSLAWLEHWQPPVGRFSNGLFATMWLGASRENDRLGNPVVPWFSVASAGAAPVQLEGDVAPRSYKGSSDSVAKCKIVPKAGGLALAWFDRTALRWTIQQQGGSAIMAVTVVMALDAPDAAKLLLSNVHGDLAALWHDEEGIHLTSLAPNSHSWSPPRLLISNPFELDKRGKRQNSVEYYLVAAELDRSGRRVHVVWKASQGNELSVGSVSLAAN